MGAPATAVKERPILFSGPMVRAILDGTKTQTRRVVTDQGRCLDLDDDEDREACRRWGEEKYGQPGDRLWVRETFSRCGEYGPAYRADWGPEIGCEPWDTFTHLPDDETRWRPSIHMPRWASRILLEVVSVRVERLQEISEADCWAEGQEAMDGHFDNAAIFERAAAMRMSYEDAKPSFSLLWDSINAARGYGWDTNPWVWVIEFKRIEGGAA